MIRRLRYWLITKLAGGDGIVLNMKADQHLWASKSDRLYIGQGTYSGITFETDTR